MRPKSHLIVNLIVVALLGVLMTGWVVTRVLGSGVLEQPMRVTADFAASGGVFTGQEVTYRGVVIGSVGDPELNDGGVDIELLIEPEWDGLIPAEVTAEVKSKSAVGEQYVNLTPAGSGSEEMLADGATIARSATHLPVDFQELLASLDEVLSDVGPERTRRVIQNLAAGLRGRSEDISSILESLGTLSDAFADTSPEQRRLLANSVVAGREFLRTKEAFADAIRAADDVVEGIGDEPEELEALLTSNDRFARAATALLRRRGDDLAGGIGALEEFTSFQLANQAELIDKSLRYVPAFLHAVEDSSVPWRSPDGREFYRIRVGLVVEDVESSWPCKYKLPRGYERFPHQRRARDPVVDAACRRARRNPSSDSLVAALRQWAEENPAGLPDLPLPPFGDFKPAPGDGFIWPVDGEVTSGFGPRDGGMHTGLDIDTPTGTPVVAAQAGVVTLVDVYYGYGSTVIIDHGDGFASLYGHLSEYAVGPDDRVERGDIIGLVGCTGSCTGDHLHFEIRIEDKPVDPLPYLPDRTTATAPVTNPAPSPHPSPLPALTGNI
ncbi:MAG: MCE family protein [Actinomycetota bacterium]